MAFDVHAVDSKNRSQSGRCVEVILKPEFVLLSFIGSRMEEYADDEGHASFETADDGYMEVGAYVSGENQGTFDIYDGAGESPSAFRRLLVITLAQTNAQKNQKGQNHETLQKGKARGRRSSSGPVVGRMSRGRLYGHQISVV